MNAVSPTLRITIAALIILLLALVVCRRPGAPATILIGKNQCETYELPGVWSYPDGRDEDLYIDRLEFRKLDSHSSGLCAAPRLQFAELMATQMICLSDGKSELLPIDPAWEAGTLLTVRHEEDYDAPNDLYSRLTQYYKRNSYDYPGISLRKRGDDWVWSSPAPSIDYRYIILHSMDRDNFIERHSGIGIFGSSGGTADSPVYVQVFDLRDGKEVVVIRYDLSRMFYDTVSEETGWLDQRTFISGQTFSNKLIVCTLP